MPPDAQSLVPPRALAAGRLEGAWRAALMRLVPAWLALIAAFLPDWLAMARQWWDISTYNHILLIPAILAWLVWQLVPELRRIEPSLWWPGLACVAAAVFLWLLGALSGLDLARQLGAVLVLVAACLLLLGPRVCAGLSFPLGYMLLLVPFGDEFVPLLQLITTAISITLVEWSGIPSVVNGVFIDTPAGLFEVAEACSGVKFLIAMIAFAILLAHLCFVSWKRRAVLLAVCIVVPVLANGIRAFATIWLAQFVGIEKAAGFDHIVYGWLFFALVLGLILAMAWRYFDRPAGDPLIRADAINASSMLARAARLRIRAIPALVLMFLLVSGAHAWARAAEKISAPLPGQITVQPIAGWQRVEPAPSVWWEPRASGAQRKVLASFADRQGRRVDVFFAIYARQGDGAEAGGFGEGALMPDSAWSWIAPGPLINGIGSERLLAHGRVERLALTWYRQGNVTTGSNARLRLATMMDRLLLRRHPTSVLILSAEETANGSAEAAIRQFLASVGPLDRWMDRLAGQQ